MRSIASAALACCALLSFVSTASAAPVKQDYQIDGVDPGVRLFVRQKMEAGNTRFTDDNIVLFVHGATAPSVCDFDLGFKDYSWADWLVSKGYVQGETGRAR
jgi:hypothetical protein